MKDNRIWREVKRAMLAGLLCLPLCTVTAEPVTTMTGGEMETTDPVPEGYRPLPVTEFVVEAEKNDTYILSIGVKNQRIGQENDFLTEKVKGNISIYPRFSKASIYKITIPTDKGISSSGFRGPYGEGIYQGLFYYVKLIKGQYLIHPDLYVVKTESTEPSVLISFERKKFVW
ncbi:hypothetical protein E1K64_23295 [Salmonella enterica subsp. enterica serovar Poona]|nr:hypothetical protein [Salmonella enterica subsp. enterica serovar Poona]